jgi:cation:H+ antiporter
MLILLLLAGTVALVLGAELLVRGASRLAEAIGVSPLVVGLTVVAFGTSAPEMAVSVSSALKGQAGLAVGNVVGSNIFNVLLILGISALIVPLVVHQKLVRFEVPLMIGVSILMMIYARDGVIGMFEGGVLFGGLLLYTVICIIVGRRETAAVLAEYEAEFGEPEPGTGASPQQTRTSTKTLQQVVLVIGGLGLLVLGSHWLVSGATELAKMLGVSDLIIGLTIIAGGTSLPEVATSILAAVRGERDIAVGNVVGSNLFNLLGVLGLTAVVSPAGVSVAQQALSFDIPVMIAVAVACLPIFLTGHRIARWEGALFLGFYVAYVAALILMATNSPSLPLFQTLMGWFVIPLTALTLLIVSYRAVVALKRNAPEQARSPGR